MFVLGCRSCFLLYVVAAVVAIAAHSVVLPEIVVFLMLILCVVHSTFSLSVVCS